MNELLKLGQVWSRALSKGGVLMKNLVYWKPLIVSEHRNGMTTMNSRAVRTPVGTGGIRRPAGPCAHHPGIRLQPQNQRLVNW